MERPSEPLHIARSAFLLTLLLLTMLGAKYLLSPSGYGAISPGPVLDVSRLASGKGVEPRGVTYGKFLLLTVSITPINHWEMVADMFPGGHSNTVRYQKGAPNGLVQLDGSTTNAAVAASNLVPAAATDVKVVGLRVTGVTAGGASDVGLRADDVLETVDGHPVGDVSALSTVLAGRRSVAVTVLRDAKRLGFNIKTGDGTLGLRVVPQISGAFPVTFEAVTISGASGGLAFALATIDALGSGDLTGGRVVAVSGSISPNGNVGAVTGLAEKAISATSAGATVLLAPIGSAGSVRTGIEVVEVSNLSDAVNWLCANGATDSVCGAAFK